MERSARNAVIDNISTSISFYKPPILLQVFTLIYFVLSYFEIYLVNLAGSFTKYYLIVLMFAFFILALRHFKINAYWVLILLWFLYKCISLMWSDFSGSDIISSHFQSQVGMTMLYILFVGIKLDKRFVRNIVFFNWICSSVFGVLSLLFSKPYISDVYSDRIVLTLFGVQNDPNNCAAFLLVGIAVSVFYALYERRFIIPSLAIIGVNTIALFMTGSRGGFVSLIAVLIVIVFLPSGGKRLSLRQVVFRGIALAVLSIATLWLVQTLAPSASIERIFDFNEYEGGSGRDDRWLLAWYFFKENPIFGNGWGGYSVAAGQAIHNTFLTSLCDVGIIGTALLLMPIIIISIKSLKAKNPLSIIILISGLLPSFFIDAINKRFFWNALIIAFLALQLHTGDEEVIMDNRTSKREENYE